MAESVINLACVGAYPIALVNCLNFGDPERPEIMWQLSESIDGMAEACARFDIPVVGGNVSLYNASRGSNIDPTPVIGLLGMVDELRPGAPGATWAEGDRLIAVGALGDDALGLSGSLWARNQGHARGELPALDYARHAALAEFVRSVVATRRVAAVHDVSRGGVGAALTEMAIASGVGFSCARIPSHRELFSEAPSRVVMAVGGESLSQVIESAEHWGLDVERIGLATGDRISVKGLFDLPLANARTAWRDRIPAALGAGTVQA